MRVGIGYDIHPVVAGKKLFLGGLEIPGHAGLEGHSDGDVVIHAVVDALLGALGKGDIGEHFPDSDPAHKDRASSFFLETTRDLLKTSKAAVENIDINVFCKTPRLGAVKQGMTRRVAELLKIDPERVNIKAKSFNKIGEIGRGEAVAAQAVVLLSKSVK